MNLVAALWVKKNAIAKMGRVLDLRKKYQAAELLSSVESYRVTVATGRIALPSLTAWT